MFCKKYYKELIEAKEIISSLQDKISKNKNEYEEKINEIEKMCYKNNDIINEYKKYIETYNIDKFLLVKLKYACKNNYHSIAFKYDGYKISKELIKDYIEGYNFFNDSVIKVDCKWTESKVIVYISCVDAQPFNFNEYKRDICKLEIPNNSWIIIDIRRTLSTTAFHILTDSEFKKLYDYKRMPSTVELISMKLDECK